MKTAELRQFRNRAPFRPFNVHLTNSEILPVTHPENMSIPAFAKDKAEPDLFVVWTDGKWNLVEANQVARVSIAVRFPK